MPRNLFAYIKTVRSKGKLYEYFDTGKTVAGKRVYNRLPARSDKSFGQVYAGMLAGRHARENVAAVPTMAMVSRDYQRSRKWTKLAPSSQNTYLIYIGVIETHLGMAEVDAIERRDVQALMDSMMERPGAANMVLLVLRNMFKHARAREWVKVDPTETIELFEGDGNEYQPWPDTLVDAALADPDVRLPVALLLYTAQRIGDVCKMRWSDIKDGYLTVRQQKTGKELDIRLHHDLLAILERTPREAMTIIYGPKMRPMRTATLRAQLQRFAAKHGERIVPHGLRKNAVNALLEAGNSAAETGAISGQSMEVVEHYAKRRNVRRLGSAAILRWQGTKGGNGKPVENPS